MQSRSVDVSRALDQIAEIHGQMAKGEVYRGYRSVPVAAAVQPATLGTADPVGFVLYWMAIALVAGFVGASEIVYNYIVHEAAPERRHTQKVVGQFLPSLAGGAAIAACFVRLDAALVP